MFYYPPPPSPPQQGEEPNSNTPVTNDRDTNSGYHHQEQYQYHYHPHYPNYHPHQHQDQEYRYSTSYPQIRDQEYHANSTNTNTSSHLHQPPYCPPIVYHPPNPHQLGGLGTYAVSQSVSADAEITPFAESTTGNDNDNDNDTSAAAASSGGKLQQEQEGEGEEGGRLPNSLSLEDDRKPSARSCDLTLPPAHHQAYQDLEPIPLNRISTSIPVSVADGQQGYNSQHAYETPFVETCPQARTRFASTSGPYANVNDANVPSLPAHAQDPIPASTSNIGSESTREPLPFSYSARALPHTNSSGTGAAGVAGEGGAWENMFRELTEYKRANGHTDVPQKYSENAALGNWVNKVR